MRDYCLKFSHSVKRIYTCLLLVGLITTELAFAQIARSPANYTPNDEQIIVPVAIEHSFFVEDFHKKHAKSFQSSKDRLKQWVQTEEYAQIHGLENSGILDLPTPEQRQAFFERNYLRFISKDVEVTVNQTGQDLLQDWTTDDELSAIEHSKRHQGYIIKAKNSGNKSSSSNRGEAGKKTSSKSVGVWDSFDFNIQPRLEMGMVDIRVKNPYVDFRGWLGVNGNQEINLSRRFNSTNTRTQVNYFIDQKRVIASVDQSIDRHLTLRLSHDKVHPEGLGPIGPMVRENNVIQVRFRVGF